MAALKLSALPLESPLPTPPQDPRGTTALITIELEACSAPAGQIQESRSQPEGHNYSYTTHTLLLLETYRPLPPYHTLFPSSSKGTLQTCIQPEYQHSPVTLAKLLQPAPYFEPSNSLTQSKKDARALQVPGRRRLQWFKVEAMFLHKGVGDRFFCILPQYQGPLR